MTPQERWRNLIAHSPAVRTVLIAACSFLAGICTHKLYLAQQEATWQDFRESAQTLPEEEQPKEAIDGNMPASPTKTGMAGGIKKDGPKKIQRHERPGIYEKRNKYAPGTKISLNNCDTSELKMIPGIWSYYARKIVEYRERLGGFASPRQLKEIEGLPENITDWFLPDSGVYRHININRADYRELIRHPYLNNLQCRTIMEHRRKYGSIKDMNALSLYDTFTADDLKRLAPYMNFAETEPRPAANPTSKNNDAEAN